MDRPIIFLSHAVTESPIAKILKDSIEGAFGGLVDVFVSDDARSVAGGSNWLNEITNALRSCVVEIVVAGPHSISRPWINFEAGGGWVRGIPVIPVCHSGLDKGALPLPFALLQGAYVGDPGDLERWVYGSIAKAAGGTTPKLDYEGLAARLREAEAGLVEAAARAELSSIRAASVLALRSLSDDRINLEVAVFRDLLRLQGLRASGALPADADRLTRDLEAASRFWQEPASFSDLEVANLRDELEGLLATIEGTDGPRFGDSGEVASPGRPDTRLELLRALRDLNRREQETSQILSLDIEALAAQIEVDPEEIRVAIADMLADGSIESHYATFGEGPLQGAIRITGLGMAELASDRSATLTSVEYSDLRDRVRRLADSWNELKMIELGATKPAEIRALVAFREYASTDLTQLEIALAAATTAPENHGIEYLDAQIRLAQGLIDDLRGMIERAITEEE